MWARLLKNQGGGAKENFVNTPFTFFKIWLKSPQIKS
jgi:hypothetical protein